MMGKIIELFTDSSRFSNDLEMQVRNYACARCSILIYDAINSETEGTMATKMAEYGITKLPAVSIDGKIFPLEKLEKGHVPSLIRKFFHK